MSSAVRVNENWFFCVTPFALTCVYGALYMATFLLKSVCIYAQYRPVIAHIYASMKMF